MKRATIRKRVKNHIIKRGGECDFNLNESFCLYWWRHLNEAVFDGKLKQPTRFELRRFKYDTAGWCAPFGKPSDHNRTVRIGISTRITDRRTFLEVLGHEMVHQWEWEVLKVWDDDKGAHGPAFYSWREPLAKRAGLSLAASYDIVC